jgi:hypothetical protein
MLDMFLSVKIQMRCMSYVSSMYICVGFQEIWFFSFFSDLGRKVGGCRVWVGGGMTEGAGGCGLYDRWQPSCCRQYMPADLLLSAEPPPCSDGGGGGGLAWDGTWCVAGVGAGIGRGGGGGGLEQ